MLQASESHTGGNLILGNLGCISSINPIAWISSALWFASWLRFLTSYLCWQRCFWVAIWEAQPIFVLWIFNSFRELNFRPQTHEKSVQFSLIIILFSFSEVPIAGSCRLVVRYCTPSRMPDWVWWPLVMCCSYTTCSEQKDLDLFGVVHENKTFKNNYI